MTLIFDPPVIAHRGASGDAPENTMVAFTRALQQGIAWIECDVMLAAGGTPIIFHDEMLDRTTSSKGGVGEYPYAWLSSVDAGAWFNSAFAGERIPSLRQLAEFLQDTGLSANIEIKPLPGQDAETVIAALQVLAEYFPALGPSLLFSSFFCSVLTVFKTICAALLSGFVNR